MKQLLVMFMLLCSTAVFAQDVIVKKDGSTVVCRVVELTSSEIVYKKWSDLNGSNYIMNRSDATAINYENGKKENLSEAGTNLYAPGNQNDGVQQYNDRALLQLDYATNNPYKKVKKIRTIGWIGGTALVIGGGIILLIGNSKGGSSSSGYKDGLIAGGVIMGCGVAFTTTFLILANKEKKKIGNQLQSFSLWQKDINLKNGSTLMAGVDVIKDNLNQKQTLGIGLRYNF